MKIASRATPEGLAGHGLSTTGVEPAELSEIAVDREVFQVLLWMLPPRPSLEENRVRKRIK